MNVHSVYRRLSPIFRKRRMRRFRDRLRPSAQRDAILDVGGYPATWADAAPCARKLEILNIHEFPMDESFARDYHAAPVVGDATRLHYDDDAFDIVFSNSVIEHVGTWENQQRFAAETRRVGRALWIQTPARGFFIEPHYIAPFIHWLPRSWQRRLARRFTLWGWMQKPTPAQIEARLDEIRLLTRREMEQLFPDCEILREPFLLVFTKSYVAIRDREAGGGSPGTPSSGAVANAGGPS